MRGRSAPAALLLALLLALSGCGVTELNAGAYVQGMLDATYKGEYGETWLALVDADEEEAAKDYRAGLLAERGRFCARFGIELTRLSLGTREEIADYLGQVYADARYEVEYATRSESGAWLVEVTVQPIRTFAVLLEEGGAAEELRARFDADETITDVQRPEAWAAAVLELCRGTVAEYGEKTTIAVRLIPDEEGYYAIGAQDFYHLDALVLTYAN